MSERTRPTAEELGITELEYERILRGLQQRELDQIAAPAAAAARPSAAEERARFRGRVQAGACLLLAVAIFGVYFTLDAGDAPSGGPGYEFLQTAYDHPVTYSSCRPIRVAVYPAGGPPDAAALVREAVEIMAGATGLDITVAGVFGGHAPNWNFEAAPTLLDDPISVSWQDQAAIAELTDDVLGLGGSRIYDGAQGPQYVAGTIALSRERYADYTEDGDHGQALATLLHEFGHVLGLGHVNSRSELMYPRATERTSLGAGDLEGLRLLGQGPCA